MPVLPPSAPPTKISSSVRNTIKPSVFTVFMFSSYLRLFLSLGVMVKYHSQGRESIIERNY